MFKLYSTSFIFLVFVEIVYSQSISFGNQIWSANNLNVKVFRNGAPISQAKTEQDWEQANKNSKPIWGYTRNGEVVYNYFAIIDKRELAPLGWHIPHRNEWERLIDYLGGKSVAGWKLKVTSGWSGKSKLKSFIINYLGSGVYDTWWMDFDDPYGLFYQSSYCGFVSLQYESNEVFLEVTPLCPGKYSVRLIKD